MGFCWLSTPVAVRMHVGLICNAFCLSIFLSLDHNLDEKVFHYIQKMIHVFGTL